ncbi:MAG TPA: DUF2490 domain-containing protein [Nitrospiria bacterium]|nr:DUF2490 domain-containing protein [Nitrospiria bacterium]
MRRTGAALTLTVAGAVFTLLAVPALAGESQTELVPEINAFVQLSDTTRLYFRADLTRNLTEDTSDGLIGVHLDITIKPILRRKLREADWERDRYFWMRIGYQLLGNLDGEGWGSTEDRGIIEATGRAPLPVKFWLVNRIRVDLRYMETDFSARFRERLGIERQVVVFGVITVPYAEAEIFYDTRYDAWNQQRYQAGAEIGLTERWRIEPYYARQENQRSKPAHLNIVGFIVKSYW